MRILTSLLRHKTTLPIQASSPVQLKSLILLKLVTEKLLKLELSSPIPLILCGTIAQETVSALLGNRFQVADINFLTAAAFDSGTVNITIPMDECEDFYCENITFTNPLPGRPQDIRVQVG